MANLKEGDRVRWLVTSQFIATFRAEQRAEVVSVDYDREGRITTFKNLDYQGKTDHTYVVVGEIPAKHFEAIT